MAAFTPTGVKAGADAQPRSVTALEAITAGNAITGSGYIVLPSSSDESKLKIVGISVTDAAINGTAIFIPKGGKVTVTNTLTYPRNIIALASGQWGYDGDLPTTQEFIIIGYSIDANTIIVDPKYTTYNAP